MLASQSAARGRGPWQTCRPSFLRTRPQVTCSSRPDSANGHAVQSMNQLMKLLDDHAFQTACQQGRQAWVDLAIEPTVMQSTGIQVHVLGVVHDAPSNVHDILSVARAVQPQLVLVEALPCQAPIYLQAAQDLAPVLEQLAQQPMSTDAQARHSLAKADPDAQYISSAAQLSAQRLWRLQQAAHQRSAQSHSASCTEAAPASADVKDHDDIMAQSLVDPGAVQEVARAMTLSGCPQLTEELGVAYTALSLGIPLEGVDMPAGDLSLLLQRTTVVSALDKLLRNMIAGRGTPTASGGGRHGYRSSHARWAGDMLDRLHTVAHMALCGEPSAHQLLTEGVVSGSSEAAHAGNRVGHSTLVQDALARSSRAQAAGDLYQAAQALLTALPQTLALTLSHSTSGRVDRLLTDSIPLASWQQEMRHLAFPDPRFERPLLQSMLHDKGVDADRLYRVRNSAVTALRDMFHMDSADPGANNMEEQAVEVVNQYWRWLNDAGNHMNGDDRAQSRANSGPRLRSVVRGAYSVVSVGDLLRCLLERLEVCMSVALGPSDMHELSVAVPKVSDPVLIRPRDLYMAGRVAAVVRHAVDAGQQVDAVLVVVGRAHVHGVIRALNQTQ